MKTQADQIHTNTVQAISAASAGRLPGGDPLHSLQDNRPKSVIQKKQVEALANKSSDNNSGVVQLARGDRPEGNAGRKGGKSKKKRAVLSNQIVLGPAQNPVSARPPKIQATGSNPLATLMNLSQMEIDSDRPERIKRMLRQAGEHFNQPHMQPANAYLNSLRDQFGGGGGPANVKLKDITPDSNEHGYYNNVNKKLSLGVLNSEMAENYDAGGYGTAAENLAETGVHEYTHVFDLETARTKPYRQQALQNLNNALPFMAPGQAEQVNAARMARMKQAGGLIDPHIDLTIGQGFLSRGSHVPLLSELMANFAELGSTRDPVGHLMMRDGAHQQDGETPPQYQQRITGDYDLLMQNAVLPYATGVVNDNTLPKGIRDFYLHSLLIVPTSGAELHAAMTQRRTDFIQSHAGQAVLLQHLANANPQMQPLADQARTASNRQKLRQKIQEKRDQRRRK